MSVRTPFEVHPEKFQELMSKQIIAKRWSMLSGSFVGGESSLRLTSSRDSKIYFHF
jgi:hypothetical protein